MSCGREGTLEDNSLAAQLFSIYLVVIRISHHGALILIIRVGRNESAKEEKSQKLLHKERKAKSKVLSWLHAAMRASCGQAEEKRLERRVAQVNIVTEWKL